ncbi:MAG: hypothetical protein Q4E13_13070 [Clostridia bacterium]|nr:hypothetical protein [Clostridia bacterium]
MSFWQKIKDGFRRFMNGRHGADQLSLALLYAAIALDLIYVFSRAYLLSLLATLLIVWALFRILSRNGGKRYAENQRFLAFVSRVSTAFRQWRTRMANRKEYKYFRCPQCHSLLRMKRGLGEKTVTCGNCKHQFRKKA